MADPVQSGGSALGGACRFAGQTLPDALPADPFPTLASWLAEAADRNVQPNPNSMTLATIAPDGRPEARIVLCRGLNIERGCLVFFTNYHSDKGLALAATAKAAVVFHWDALDRQARIEGPVTRSPASESDAYFNSRTATSRVAAWASAQSKPITSRAALLEQNRAAMARFGVHPGMTEAEQAKVQIPRPEHWGGYRIWAERVELWMGHTNRLHDRAVWKRSVTAATVDGVAGYSGGAWSAMRLQP